jgi:hypothetical protein
MVNLKEKDLGVKDISKWITDQPCSPSNLAKYFKGIVIFFAWDAILSRTRGADHRFLWSAGLRSSQSPCRVVEFL